MGGSEQPDMVIAINLGLECSESGRIQILNIDKSLLQNHIDKLMIFPEHIYYNLEYFQDPNELCLPDLASGRSPEILKWLENRIPRGYGL